MTLRKESYERDCYLIFYFEFENLDEKVKIGVRVRREPRRREKRQLVEKKKKNKSRSISKRTVMLIIIYFVDLQTSPMIAPLYYT